jgi:hypothetical protein
MAVDEQEKQFEDKAHRFSRDDFVTPAAFSAARDAASEQSRTARRLRQGCTCRICLQARTAKNANAARTMKTI